MLGTLAAAYAESGEFKAAVQWEKKSLEAMPKQDKDYQSALQRLDDYMSRSPHRE